MDTCFRPIAPAEAFPEPIASFAQETHAHAYMPDNDAEEERLMSEIEWNYSPLQPGDEWD